MNYNPNDQRMYVLVRGDLSPGYQAAQAIHAAVDEALERPEMVRLYPTVVVLNVASEAELYEYAVRYAMTAFHEPDLDGEMTAAATFSSGEEFRELPLALEVRV